MFLQQQLRANAVEREQALAVLNEKTRENSWLRGDYQHIIRRLLKVAGKESVLLKVQQENMRPSTMSDPSASREMFRETIQNLSRIIRRCGSRQGIESSRGVQPFPRSPLCGHATDASWEW